DDLARAGIDPALRAHPGYVRAVPAIDGVEMFDAGFFGYTRLEAEVMDPQQRLFLEAAWQAFEDAGWDPQGYPWPIGVFTGAKTNTYLLNLVADRERLRRLDTLQLALGNDLACMATRVSYKLDLRGPSYALHTACSTSLVAVHLACQSLLIDECRMAVAGGAAVNVPQRKGYLYQPGGILSPDGTCRTFDAGARGTVMGSGAGVVVLKRLEDALADGDHVYAVVKGSAANNDGARKASYTAPGVEGQTAVILEALAVAGVDADTISYIEAHGTATDLGDSIEMLALTEAFRAGTESRGFCALGSVKTNVGHLETAAGIAGLVKTALALEREQLPPSLHFERPNPKIDFANSPFYVNDRLREWKRTEGQPRRAGLSSFGIGSTNIHMILEEAPEPEPAAPARPWQLLPLSARSEAALENATANLAEHLRLEPGIDLADAAWTLQAGRRRFRHRRAVVCRGLEDALALLEDPKNSERVVTQADEAAERSVAFLFPGLGELQPDSGLGLYRSEPAFRAEVDRCCELLRPHLGMDLREALFPGLSRPKDEDEKEEQSASGPDLRRMLGRGPAAGDSEAARRLRETSVGQPAAFVLEWALARLWMEWGIRPAALIGYSVGEYVAACVAGVLPLEQALALVARRARLIQELPPGAMLAVPFSAEEARPWLDAGLSLAAVNTPRHCVLSGQVDLIEELERRLAAEGTPSRRLATTHAFHSAMMEPAAEAFAGLVRTFELQAPQIPYVSNLTGTWIRDEEATDPGYWARHL
ncbi:MAG TPA: type I polyketide synthase, partial [Thermoanaerobaculia bacterium]